VRRKKANPKKRPIKYEMVRKVRGRKVARLPTAFTSS
jgi:hypothetical protein